MLFFGTVAGVDDCKFKFNDDIEEQLLFDSSKKTAGQHEETVAFGAPCYRNSRVVKKGVELLKFREKTVAAAKRAVAKLGAGSSDGPQPKKPRA